jgi:hypothetical protein
MNRLRKLTLTSTSALLALLLAGQALAATPTFTDITASPAKDAITSLQERGYVAGYTNSEFRPDKTLSVAEGASIIANTLDLSLAAISFTSGPYASAIFSNVKDNAWYANALINAHYNGVEFPADLDPNVTLTREEYTAFLMQGLEKAGNLPMIKLDPQPITDEADIDALYQGGIQRALHYGLIKLDSGNKFEPKKAISRGEAALMAFNARTVLDAKLAEQAQVPAE